MSVVRYSASSKVDALQQVHRLQSQGYSRRGAVAQVTAQLGCRAETLKAWLHRDDTRQRSQHGNGHAARIQRLEREVALLARINAELRMTLTLLESQGEADLAPGLPQDRHLA